MAKQTRERGRPRKDKFREEEAAGPPPVTRTFKMEYANGAQKLAWQILEKHDISFLVGPAGTGKSHLAMSYAISEIIAKKKKRIFLTRPIVEAGEKLGFLPGSFEEKVNPYMLPLLDIITKCVGTAGGQFEAVVRSMEFAPLAYLRGRTFDDAICIFDESQNATMGQMMLFLTRLGKNSKMIITGDPTQSDIPCNTTLQDVVSKLQWVDGIGMVELKTNSIVRHPLVGKIIETLGT
jgi:phosphate starvation-inducible PhoH-like protein